MNLRKSLFILPNLFTLSSIFCGFDAMRLMATAQSPAVDQRPYASAALLLVFAAFFDIIDGRVARMTRTQSAFGLQFDSLADVVSFGVAPALLVYRWSLADMGLGGMAIAFAFLACGAIRLARFNVLSMNVKSGAPSKPSKYIVGLPIPGAAGVILAVIIANNSVHGSLYAEHGLVAALVLGLSALMVSTVSFRSFKDVKWSWRTGLLVALGAGTTLAVGLLFGAAFTLPWMMGVYISIALIETIVTFPRRHAERRLARSAQNASANETSSTSAE